MKKSFFLILILVSFNVKSQNYLDTLVFNGMNARRIVSGIDPFIFDTSIHSIASDISLRMLEYKSIDYRNLPYSDGECRTKSILVNAGYVDPWGFQIVFFFKKRESFTIEQTSEAIINRLTEDDMGKMMIFIHFDLDKEMLGKSEKEIYHVGMSTYESEDGYYGTLLVYLPR